MTESRLKLLYGVNEADSWWHFAIGPRRERIWARLREMDVRIIRIFLYQKGTPDPVSDWKTFAAYVQAVLDVGAIPMVTFAQFPGPIGDGRAIRAFANRCGDVVWSALEHWGPATVREWMWCVWNEPNNTWIGGGVSFEQYRAIYESVAEQVVRWLAPHLRDGPPRLGGPSVEGFQPFWLDWIWRFVEEIDHSLIGFVNWHLYADWREDGEEGAPLGAAAHRGLMLAQTPEYGARARAVAETLNGFGALNICGEWNAHSHYLPSVRARFNQSLFGAAYGVSALLHLMRGGVDAEMLWTGTDEACGYGVLDKDAHPTPLFHAKCLCTRHIRRGDWISFPMWEHRHPELDSVIARGDDGQVSALIVHLSDDTATYPLSELNANLSDCRTVLKIDGETGNQVRRRSANGTVGFYGYGVAVVTNAEPNSIIT
jgi:hypothetical protein